MNYLISIIEILAEVLGRNACLIKLKNVLTN